MDKYDFRTMALIADLKAIGLLAITPLLTLAVYIAAHAAWPLIALLFERHAQYFFLRTLPFAVLTVPFLLTLAVVVPMPLHHRRPLALSSMASFLVVLVICTTKEYLRLMPYHQLQHIAWEYLLPYANGFLKLGAAIGLAACAAVARLSLNTKQVFKYAKMP